MNRFFSAFVAVLALLAGCVAAPAQDDAGRPVAMGSGRMVRGTVTSAAPGHLTLKTEAGEVYQIALNPNTQVRKGRDQVKPADIHAGDGIGAVGEIDQPNHTVHALYVFLVDAEQLRKARENLGKTYIAGTITAIADLKLTILRPDKVTQVIAVDEDTSFKRGRARGAGLGSGAADGGFTMTAPTAGSAGGIAGGESITLGDIKVGENVAGEGSLKNGIFVPTRLLVSEPGQGRRHRQTDGAGSQSPAQEPR